MKDRIQAKLGVYTVEDRDPVTPEFAADRRNKRSIISAVQHHRLWKVRGDKSRVRQYKG